MGVTSAKGEAPEDAVAQFEGRESAILESFVPDKVEVLALVGRALSWDPTSAEFPPTDEALELARVFTSYGRIVANDLSAVLAGVPADSPDVRCAQATLSEAGRRLGLMPLGPTVAPRVAAQRAQNLARLVQALNRSVGQIGEARVRPSPHSVRHEGAGPSARAPSAPSSARRHSP
ncbi:DUF6415 family natural product biosynthesis protein [Streptomyces poriferorum]|uniref:DUF6415 family natural product biosynthesis protein n=1 Tax=Streptomyces poriferorum TaxID=2798799 RepID=A0ABY9IKU4_9ACTN|nr:MULTISPECIES: DUF6415 family natural product biosynthesis protein [unclassified Streptomyces]MDP5315341.1 DUF6415 family natural product biosynthesis protein [Streptomyces sp. Alt4]WLQ55800.1 DUF6415 family natural product biosynthesis protein [Streptomyces sp. Alt2]